MAGDTAAAGGQGGVDPGEAAAGQRPPAGGTVTTLVAGLPDRARKRLDELGGYELVTDVQRGGEARLVVVSTRLPRGDVRSFLDVVRDRLQAPLVALVHTGGEALAVEVMRAGGAGVVAGGQRGGPGVLPVGHGA